jgi:hypothetical protein
MRGEIRNLENMLGKFERRAGASLALISDCEEHFNQEFPKDYRDFMMTTNGGEGFIGLKSYVMLWSIEELPSLNDGYETSNYLPRCVLFGSNGGGEAYGFDMRTSRSKIVQVPFVGMAWKSALLLSDSFSDFILQLYEA